MAVYEEIVPEEFQVEQYFNQGTQVVAQVVTDFAPSTTVTYVVKGMDIRNMSSLLIQLWVKGTVVAAQDVVVQWQRSIDNEHWSNFGVTTFAPGSEMEESDVADNYKSNATDVAATETAVPYLRFTILPCNSPDAKVTIKFYAVSL